MELEGGFVEVPIRVLGLIQQEIGGVWGSWGFRQGAAVTSGGDTGVLTPPGLFSCFGINMGCVGPGWLCVSQAAWPCLHAPEHTRAASPGGQRAAAARRAAQELTAASL